MCGICGFVGQGDEDVLKTMMDTLQHRGPDQSGQWIDADKGVHLGHRRLSILDLESGQQPMWTEDSRLAIIFNGEIYNHAELRDNLESKGHRFRSDHSDTEVLLVGYREWGPKVVEFLSGMWAVAIYDRLRHSIWLSRDRFGKKPLFYSLSKKAFVFASELSAVVQHPTIDGAIDRLSLQKYYAYGYVPAPRSMYQGVWKLPAGHNLEISLADLSLKTERYWRLVLEPFQSVTPQAVLRWEEEIRDLLFKAIEKRLVADVPVGVFLSGGIDSSSVISMTTTLNPGQDIKTFSVGFEERSFDESDYASEISNIFGTEHQCSTLTSEGLLGLVPDVVGLLDEPFADTSLIPSYLMCKVAREDVTVALGGDGSDELFAGYDPFKALSMASMYARFVPKPVHYMLRGLVSTIPVSHRNMSLDFKLKRSLTGLSYPPRLWNPVWLGMLEPKELGDLFGENIDTENLYSEAIESWNFCDNEDLVDKTLQFYTEMYLQNDILSKMDRAGMMNSLEVRSPYLDKDLVDLVRRIPSNYKFGHGETKYILKRALECVLPVDILKRPKKGFGVPVGQWFKNGSLDLDSIETDGAMDRSFIERAQRQHRVGKRDWRSFLWATWVFERWKEKQATTIK